MGTELAKDIRDKSGKIVGGEGDLAHTYKDPNDSKINPGGLGDLARKNRKAPPVIEPTPTPKPLSKSFMSKKALGGAK